jgi:hypothetical protein
LRAARSVRPVVAAAVAEPLRFRHPAHLGDDVVEEVVDLPLVVATTELGLGERLVEDVLG